MPTKAAIRVTNRQVTAQGPITEGRRAGLYFVDTRKLGVTKTIDADKGEYKTFKTAQEANDYAAIVNAQQAVGGAVSRHMAGTVAAAAQILKERVLRDLRNGYLCKSYVYESIRYIDQWLKIDFDGGKLAQAKCMDLGEENIEALLDTFVCETRKDGRVIGKRKPSHSGRVHRLDAMKAILKVAKRKGWVLSNAAADIKLRMPKYRTKDTAQRVYKSATGITLEKQTKNRTEERRGNHFKLDEVRPIIEKALSLDVARISKKDGRVILPAWCDGLAIAFAFQTGLRFGEQAALRWEHFDFESGRVSVEVAQREEEGGTIVVDIPKHTKRNEIFRQNRLIPLDPVLLRQLKEWKMRSPHSEPTDLVFPTRAGTNHVSAHNLTRILRRVVKLVKEDLGDDFAIKRMIWKDCRHFYASVQIKLFDKNWYKVANRMGHQDIATTRKHYDDGIDDRKGDSEDAAAQNSLMWGSK